MMLYDTWHENGSSAVTSFAGNTKRRIMRPRRFSEDISEIQMPEHDIENSEALNDEISQDSMMEDDMLHDIAKISSRQIDIKKGYMMTQERSIAAVTENDFACTS